MRFSLLVLLGLAGCPKKVPVVPHPSLVYALERGGVVSHIMGTCHLPLELEERVDPRLIDAAQVVWVEAEPEDIDPAALMADIWKEDQSLTATLGREDFTRLSRRAVGAIPASMAEHFAPWVLATTLGLDALLTPEQRQVMQSEQALTEVLDAKVIQRARAIGVPLLTLETAEEQQQVLASLKVDLAELLDPSDESRRASAWMLELCTVNNLAAVDPSLYADTPDNRVLLHDRNRRWMDQLGPAFSKGDQFAAVGALHLPGPEGLLQQFADRGYRVTNLPRPHPPGPLPQLPPPHQDRDLELLPSAQRDEMATQVATAVCSNEAEVARSCFHPDPSSCVTELHHDAALCLDQRFSTASQVQLGANHPLLQACVLSGMIGRAVAQGFPDRPGCEPLRAASKR